MTTARNAKARWQAGSSVDTKQQAKREPTADPREHQGIRTRRAFLVWAVLAGLAKPERLTEAVLRDVEREGDA